MGFKNRYTAMFMVVCIVLSMFSGVTFAAPGEDDPIPEIPGALILDKSVTHEANSDLWEVTVSLNGLDRITTSDVVLVIDKSGSMQGTKLANTKIAANEFVDNLLKEDNNTRIAIVTFNDTANTNITFTNDKTALKNTISNISANGGTNIQAGIRRGDELLSSSHANNKYIVLLGDGEPTFSYGVTNIYGISISSHTGSSPNFVLDDRYTAGFNYSRTVGSGSDFNLTGANRSNISISCPTTHGSHTYTVSDNGFATIAEANAVKNKNIEIYTVALSAGSNGEAVLKKCANSNDNYYQMNNAADTAGLTQAFVEIAGKIAFAATNVVIDDPMGEMFTLVSSTIVFKKGGVPYDPEPGDFQLVSVDGRDGQKIIWKIPSVENASSPITLTYTIRIEQGVNPRTNFATNGPTTVSYIDVDGNEQTKEFFVPIVNSGDYGTILMKHYLVNEDGYALTAQGQPASKIEDVEFLHQEYYERLYYTDEHPEGEYLTSHHGSFTITASPKMAFTKDGHIINGALIPGDDKNFGDTSPILATVDVANQQIILYFAYEVQNTFNVTFHENATAGQTVSDMPDPSTVTVISGELLPEPIEPTSTGYLFEGWYTGLTDGNVKWDFDSDPVLKDFDLYAGWVASEHTVSFMSDNVEFSSETVAHGAAVSAPDPAPIKEGYQLAGWSLTDGGALYNFDTLVTEDITLYAKWTSMDQVTVTFNSNGGSAVDAQTIDYNTFASEPPVPTKDGFRFDGWFVATNFSGSVFDFANTRVTESVTLNAKWTSMDQVTVTFNSNGGSAVDAQTIDYNTFASL